MNKRYFLVSLGSIFVSLSAYVYMLYSNMVEIERGGVDVALIQENLSPITEISSSEYEDKVRLVKDNINDTASKIRKIRGGRFGIVGNEPVMGKEQALESTANLNREFMELSNEYKKLHGQYADLLSEYQKERANFLEIIKSLEKPKNSKEAEFDINSFVIIFGIVSSMFTMFLAWRKDSREIVMLKLQLQRQKRDPV